MSRINSIFLLIAVTFLCVMNFKTFFWRLRHSIIVHSDREREKSLVNLARLNRCVTMVMPEDITLTLHSIEYVNVWINLRREPSIAQKSILIFSLKCNFSNP